MLRPPNPWWQEFYVCSVPTLVLFDYGATNSFISQKHAKKLSKATEPLDYDFAIPTPLGDCVVANSVMKNYQILVNGKELMANLIPLAMNDFDVILGMDWLATHHATLDYFEKKIVFRMPRKPEFHFKNRLVFFNLMSLNALEDEPQEDTSKKKLKIEDVPIVRNYAEVFLEELSGLLPD